MSVTINGSTGVTTPGISNSEGYTGDGLTIAAGAPSGAVAVDSSGNVGIGTSSPGYKLDVAGADLRLNTPSGTAAFRLARAGTNKWAIYNDTSETLHFYSDAAGLDRAVLDSSGNLLVGATSGSAVGKIQGYANVNHDAFYAQVPTGSTGGGTCYVGQIWNTEAFFAYWAYNGSQVGYIRTNGTSTTYATSSDYRLKENIQPMTGALAKVQALKPCTYNWKADGSDGEGFIAHELQEVVPECVTGEKDAVDAEGKPVYQGIDTSFLVATLTAAIQEQQAIINAQQAALTQLQADVAALKGQA